MAKRLSANPPKPRSRFPFPGYPTVAAAGLYLCLSGGCGRGANPNDPATQFEKRRFSLSQFWALMNYRVMQEALQVRGRNIRGPGDLGVTFFISQQFRRFVRASLPEWLQSAYVGDKTFDDCVDEAVKLLE